MMRARRGSALILVLMMTLAIAGLSIAAIFMSSRSVRWISTRKTSLKLKPWA